MTKPEDATPPDVGPLLVRGVRPCAYRLRDAEANSWLYYSEEELHDIAKATLLPLYDKAALDAAVAAERERWIAKAGAAYTEAHAIFNDPPSETAQEVRNLIEWHLHRMRHDEIEGPNVAINLPP